MSPTLPAPREKREKKAATKAPGPSIWARTWFLLPLLLVIILFWAAFVAQVPPTGPITQIPIKIKASDLATGTLQVRPEENVTLVVTETGKDSSAGSILSNIRVLDISDANGRSVVYTGEVPDSVILGIPEDKLDTLLTAMQSEKRVVYLKSQGEVIYSPTPTSVPQTTATSTPIPVVFALTGPIQPLATDLPIGQPILIILVVSKKDADGKTVSQEASSYKATLLSALSTAEKLSTAPYVRLALKVGDPSVLEFARQLAAAAAIYVLPREVDAP